MATASTTRKAPPNPSVGKLKTSSKTVPQSLDNGSKKPPSKSKTLRLRAATPMAASDTHTEDNHPMDAPTAAVGAAVEENEESPSPYEITSESLGSLVCISGRQIGVLRYFGQTHFQSGLWCGVECNNAVGKNDGSVTGVRYFNCPDKYGIFAPLSKVALVSKIPPSASEISGKTLKEPKAPASVTAAAKLVAEQNNQRPNGFGASTSTTSKTKCGNSKQPESSTAASNTDTVVSHPAAPTTTPVTEDIKYLPSFGAKRIKKDAKRGKDSCRLNTKQKKKRKLDMTQLPKEGWATETFTDSTDELSTTTTNNNNSDDDDIDIFESSIEMLPKSSAPSFTTTSKPVSSSNNVDLPNLLSVKLKDEILGSGFNFSPVFSPKPSYSEAFASHLATSTPKDRATKAASNRMERLRYEKYNNFGGTPQRSRGIDTRMRLVQEESNNETKVDDCDPDEKDCRQEPVLATPPRRLPAASIQSSRVGPQPDSPPIFEESFDTLCAATASSLATVPETTSATDSTLQDEAALSSPVSSTKEESGSDVVNLESFPARRPSSINLFPGLSSEESSELGIFGVSTPELIGGDSASLALSIPTSCCTSPEALDNESSLGLLTPSHLQDCWNSNANDDDIYQHLRSPSVDDLEEFEEEDKTVDQDLSELGCNSSDSTYRKLMSSSLNGTLVVNQNDGLAAIRHPMHHSLHEGLLMHGHGRVRRDRTYTQLPTVPNLNQQQHSHQPLSFRESGSGSGSGYYASDLFTDSDFNTESEADHDHDECSSSATASGSVGGGVSNNSGSNGINNPTSLKNRSARVIDGALYTSHHHHHDRESSPSHSNQTQPHAHHPLHQQSHLLHNTGSSTSTSRPDTAGSTGVVDTVGKCIDMISSAISVSVSSNSASACASEMESSGVYSDASERNPSGGGSVMSESDGYRSSRHLSKSSSDCDDSVALSLGMKAAPLKPLSQSEDLVGYSNEKDIIEILSSSSVYDDMSNSSDAHCSPSSSFLTDTKSSSMDNTLRGGTSSGSTTVEEDCSSPKKVAIVTTNPPTVEYQKDREQVNNNSDQRVPRGNDPDPEEAADWGEDEDMDVDLFAEYEIDNEMKSENEMETFCGSSADFSMKSNGTTVTLMNAPIEHSSSTLNNLGSPLIGLLATNSAAATTGEMSGSKTNESSFPLAHPVTLASSHNNDVVEMELELSSTRDDGDDDDEVHGNKTNPFCNELIGSSPVTTNALHVTAKSCVTAGGATSIGSRLKPKSKPGAAATGFSSQNRAPSLEILCCVLPHGESSVTVKEQGKGKQSSRGGGKTTTVGKNGSKQSGMKQQGQDGVDKHGGNVEPSSGKAGASNAGASGKSATAAGSSGNNVTAEQSAVVSTTTTASGSSTSRHSSRLSATSGKSGGVVARKSASGASNVADVDNKLNTSNTSTISSSTDLSRASRPTRANGSVHGSTRSLASVGLTPSSSNKSFAGASPASKKINKWDAVMSKIAETKHKTINVRDVKSKVFNSGAKTAPGAGTGSAAATNHTNSSNNSSAASGVGKMTKGAKSGSRVTLADRCNENDPIVPPAVHRRQHHFSSRSSTISDSSLDDQPQRGPPPAKHRVKKDAAINRRQVSDLSSASDYSATQSSQAAPAVTNNKGISQPNSVASSSAPSSIHLKNMTTGSTRHTQRSGSNNGSGTSGATNGAKSSSSTASSSNATSATSTKSQGTKSNTTMSEAAKKRGVNSTQTAPSRGKSVAGKFTRSSGSSTVSTQNDPSTKSHPAVKPLRDRNRLGPVGKNYGSSGLDANANESEAPLHRGHGQTNGEVDVSGKSCTNKLAGSGEPLIDPASVDTNTTSRNLIIHKNKSTNNRVSSTNHHNIQNSVLVQENSSLKEEVGRLTSVVSDLQEQIGRLTAAGEETRQALEVCSKQSDTKCAALSIVVQQCDKERLGVYEQLVQQQAENEIWKQRLEEKLAELQKLQLEYEQEREQNQEEIRAITARHEVEVEITVRNCENKLEEMQKRHDETLAELKRSHTEELERLQESQKQELEQTIQKHRELLDQHRNQSPHDILHKEVESLQVVVEMRNEDIRVLRKDLMDYKNTLNDLQASREYGKSLLAKTEDLQAQLEKARADKRGLQENYQQLEMNLQQTEAEKDRLVRLNEELNWKMKHEYNLVEN